ncbi:MAG: non-canonical purine NTP pyrophosphatase [Bacteroidetes bacterium RBG_13_42_15]|nr:MAG: non-canonical purine NTP pyrophosphatase [Bacteroidetes bacterium RBG_13_42_15]
MKLVIATNNIHKINEIRHLLNEKIELLSLGDIGCTTDIPETQMTLEGNAAQKAFFIYERFKINCFADDTGLEIDALRGEPGVFSARYAGKNCSYEDNIRKVLSAMKDQKNRAARFKTVIALVIKGKLKTFEGIIEGTIRENKRGRNGFGYDPVFQPAGLHKTFAEISLEEKNRISHRAIALQKLVDYLKTIA